MKLQPDNGIVVGVVVDLEDPEQLGRVKVRFPHLEDKESTWARLVALMGGPDRGTFFRPEVDDEVLVAFEQGEPRRPFILGGLWSKTDKPPADDGKPKENNWRFIKSRSGHIVKLDDTEGKETVEIIDKDEKRRVVIDCAKEKIQVICDSGDIEITAPEGTVKVEAKDIQATAKESIKLEAKTIEAKAQQSFKLEAATIEVKAQGTLKQESSGVMTIKGSVVKIN